MKEKLFLFFLKCLSFCQVCLISLQTTVLSYWPMAEAAIWFKRVLIVQGPNKIGFGPHQDVNSIVVEGLAAIPIFLYVILECQRKKQLNQMCRLIKSKSSLVITNFS